MVCTGDFQMSVQQLPTVLQQLIDRLFAGSHPEGGVVQEEAAPEIRTESRHVRKILKGRRLPRSRRVFRGFESPPGRF